MHFDGGFETMEILSKPESGKDRVSVPMSYIWLWENMKTNFKTNGSKTAQPATRLGCMLSTPKNTAPTIIETSVGPTCLCRTGSSAPHQRKPERMGILIQPERAIKVGLRMFMPDGRRLVPSRFQRYLHVPHDSCGPWQHLLARRGYVELIPVEVYSNICLSPMTAVALGSICWPDVVMWSWFQWCAF